MKEKANEEVLTEKQQLKLEKKKKRRKIGRRILLGIIAVIALFIAITSLITALGNKSNLKKIATIEKVKYEKEHYFGSVHHLRNHHCGIMLRQLRKKVR